MDAVRLFDGMRVAIKRVHRNKRNELYMSEVLSQPHLSQDPSNPCSPTLALFQSADEEFQLLVLPYLLRFDEPPFSFVDEVIEFMRQTLEVSIKYSSPTIR